MMKNTKHTIPMQTLFSPFLFAAALALGGCGNLLDELGGESAPDTQQVQPATPPAPGPEQGQVAPINTDPAAIAVEMLGAEGIPTHSLMYVGPDLFITYEAALATGYDAQLFVVWGTILGALSELTNSKVTIVNTAGGNPELLVRANAIDVRAYNNGQIDLATYLSRIEFVPVPG